MIATNPNPSASQAAAWARLWSILLAPESRDKDTAPADQAETAQMEENGGRAAPPR